MPIGKNKEPIKNREIIMITCKNVNGLEREFYLSQLCCLQAAGLHPELFFVQQPENGR